MAGRGVSRVRQEEAVGLSYEIGVRAAAKQLGMNESTLRTWRRRARARGEAAVSGSAGGVEVSPLPVLPEGLSGAAELRARAARARESQADAERREQEMLVAGRATEARAAGDVADRRGRRATEFEEAAVKAEVAERGDELHRAALAEVSTAAVADLLERVFGDLGLVLPGAYLAALLPGWPAPAAEDVIEAARDEVRAPLERRIRRVVEAELAEAAEEAAVAEEIIGAGEEGALAARHGEGGEVDGAPPPEGSMEAMLAKQRQEGEQRRAEQRERGPVRVSRPKRSSWLEETVHPAFRRGR